MTDAYIRNPFDLTFW